MIRRANWKWPSADSALEDLLGVPFPQINASRLYRGLDGLHEHKDQLCQHLQERYRSWFGVQFEFLLYDVTSTYFEGQALRNAKAARGYSRDQRPDCKQVNIGLVVTPEGLPIGYEVFAGNTADVTTVEDMVEWMENKYGQPQRIWVLDRGMGSEENIDFLRQRQARYLVGTPKSQRKKFQAQLLEEKDWTEVQAGVEVKLVSHPDGEGREQYVLCRSRARRRKEAAMIELARQRLRAQLDQTHASRQRRPVRDAEKVGRRIGRGLGRFPAAERLLEVIVERDEQQRACGLQITERAERTQWAAHAHGAYLLRTNCEEKDPAQPWRWYLQLTPAEDAFRISKSDLHLRPAIDEGSGHRPQHGRRAAGARRSQPGDSPGAIASGGAAGSSRGRAFGATGSGTIWRSQAGAKCSGEKSGLTFKNPSKSSLSLPELANLG